MCVRMCNANGQWYVFFPCIASWTSVLMMLLNDDGVASARSSVE